jgi:hypothetical protein
MLWVLLVCACSSTPAEAPPEDEDIMRAESSGGSSSSGTSGPSFDDANACERSIDCEDDAAYCVAPYDPGTQAIGAAHCVTTCVSAGDLARACIDDGSCCSGSCNPVDGFCSDAPDGTSSSTGSDDPGTTSTGDASTSSSSSTG